MKTFLIIAFIFSRSLLFGQQNTITWNERKPLTWDDFTGQVKDSSSFDAESFAEVKYNYTFNGLGNFYFNVFANFNKNTSWYRQQYKSEALLKHEQVHFDIAELCARKLKETFENYHYSKNYQNEILEIFNQKKQEYHLMQKRYDEETNHSLARERQIDWEKFVATQLDQTNRKYDFTSNKTK